jgi:hypothetical protein
MPTFVRKSTPNPAGSATHADIRPEIDDRGPEFAREPPGEQGHRVCADDTNELLRCESGHWVAYDEYDLDDLPDGIVSCGCTSSNLTTGEDRIDCIAVPYPFGDHD